VAGERGRRRGRRRPGWSTDAQEIVNRVFVYASLREGEAERSMIAEYLSNAIPATTTGRMYQLAEGPVACVDDPDQRIVGEVIEINDLAAAFPLIDMFQGDDFVRVLKVARLDSGEEVWTWVYMLADPERIANATPIVGGDWLAWSAAHPPSAS
jgi:gamma-glutamylcyclotransferase (GGCT)/AIG2-like uncharacterized protein YtfP